MFREKSEQIQNDTDCKKQHSKTGGRCDTEEHSQDSRKDLKYSPKQDTRENYFSKSNRKQVK